MIEEKLNDMSYLFDKCSSLKKVKFFFTRIGAMFQLCEELEYIDLSCYNTSNVNHPMFEYNFLLI